MSVEFPEFDLVLSLEDARPSSTRVPEGKYLVECQGCEHPVVNPTSHVVTVVFVYRVLAGPDAYPNAGLGGRLIDFVTIYTPKVAEFKAFPLSKTLACLGRTDIIEAFARMQGTQRRITAANRDAIFERISQAVKGRKAVAYVSDQPGSNPPRSRIDDLSTETETQFGPGWEVLKRSTTYATPEANGPVSYTARPSGPGAAPAAQAASSLFDDLDRAI
jgi:hypothetical protein